MLALTLDALDLKLLSILQAEGRISNNALAERLNMATTPCWRRVRRLEESGAITGYRALIDQEKLGYGVTAFVHIKFASHNLDIQARFDEEIKALPEVLWCHNVSGEADFLLQVVARDLKSYSDFALNTLRALPGVNEIHSTFSLKEIKPYSGLPLEIMTERRSASPRRR